MADTVHGRVVRFPIAVGSKSDEEALGVLGPDDAFVVVHVAGDTPFVEETLASLEGQAVTVSGTWSNGKLRVVREEVRVVASEDERGEDAPCTLDEAEVGDRASDGPSRDERTAGPASDSHVDPVDASAGGQE